MYRYEEINTATKSNIHEKTVMNIRGQVQGACLKHSNYETINKTWHKTFMEIKREFDTYIHIKTELFIDMDKKL